MRIENVEQRAKRVVQKIATDQPTTAEDVQIVALYWAVSDQEEAAAAGTTTAADLELLTVVRAYPREGDAAAQTVCDAACRWRDRTRLDLPADRGGFRWLLAQTVDRYRRPRWHRHRMRIAMALGFTSGGFLAAEGVMDLAGAGPRLVHLTLHAAALGSFATSMTIVFLFHRSTTR